MRDHLDPRGSDADLLAQPPPRLLGVDDDRVEAVEVAALGGELAALARARERVMQGEHPGMAAVGADQEAVDRRQRRPLPVLDIGTAEAAAGAEHPRRVLERLQREPAAAAGPGTGAAPVEALLDAVALRGRHGPVEEAARQQLDVGAGAGERGRERAVVRRRERRWIDEGDPERRHGRRFSRWSSPTASSTRTAATTSPSACARSPPPIRRGSGTRSSSSTTTPTTARSTWSIGSPSANLRSASACA